MRHYSSNHCLRTARIVIPGDISNKAVTVTSSNCISDCILINARSLKNKLFDFRKLLRDAGSAIVFVTETWLDNTVTDGMLDPDSLYTFYRRDRPCTFGGGVMAAVPKGFNTYQIAIPNQFLNVEVVCFEMITTLDTFRFIVSYRPPEFNASGRDYMHKLYDCFTYLCDTSHTVVLVGDFNLRLIDWSVPSAVDDSIHSLFLDFCNEFGFSQFVNSPTREDSILDLVLSNDPYIVSSLNLSSSFSTSDHCTVNFSLVLDNHDSSTGKCSPVYDFDSINVDITTLTNALLCHPFNESIVLTGSADEVWDQFIKPVYAAIRQCVPTKVKTNKARKFAAKKKRYPNHINRAVNKKAALWRKLRIDKSAANKAAYSCQAALCRKLIFEYQKSLELLLIKKDNLGSFYRFINKQLSSKSGIGPLKSSANNIVTNDCEKAKMFSNYFSSVFTSDDGVVPVFNQRVPDGVGLDTVIFSSDLICKAVNKFRNGSASGPDGIPPSFLKQFKGVLSGPLCILFRYLFDLNELPVEWKSANITPVFKKGLSSDISNYRPISLTSTFCKLFERLVQQQLLQYLYHHKLITRHQHGFLARHSTCTQLLECINDWSLALRNRHAVDAVYFDFAKAFDTVSHTKLLQKLSCYGINGSLLNIISNFLNDRCQRVVLPDGTSDSKIVTSGVPQGSVLGPLLFLLYINDIADYFTDKVCIKLFADDIKIYFEIVNDTDPAIFQSSINYISEWADIWQLQLAPAKCQHIRVGLARNATNVQYSLNNNILSTADKCRDLGVIVDSHLTFNEHIDSIVSRAHLRASQILRCFASKDPETLFKAFTTYVRPLLEYCSPVWSPVTIGNINRIESVQRRFTKRLNGLAFVPYDERLLLLNAERLEIRRLRTDLITCYKIMHGYVDMTVNDFFTFNTNSNTRGHPFKLFVPDSRINARAHFFCVNVISLWNDLPDHIVCSVSLNCFVSQLKNFDLSRCILGRV